MDVTLRDRAKEAERQRDFEKPKRRREPEKVERQHELDEKKYKDSLHTRFEATREKENNDKRTHDQVLSNAQAPKKDPGENNIWRYSLVIPMLVVRHLFS